MRQQLSKCLRGQASVWFMHQLEPEMRDYLRGRRGLKRWEQRLFDKLKVCVTHAWQKLAKEAYEPADVRSDRPPAEFVMNCVRWRC